MFEAKILLGDADVKVQRESGGGTETVHVTAERRERRLKSLLALLKKQKLTANVEYTANGSGEPIAIVRASSNAADLEAAEESQAADVGANAEEDAEAEDSAT